MTADGARRSVTGRGEAERDADGQVVLVRGTVHDITERKQAEEALQRSADEIRDLYNHAPCGYHSLDKDGVFVRINDTELEWLGYAREDVIGKVKFSDLLAPSSLSTFEAEFPRLKAEGSVRDIEFDLVRKDGSISARARQRDGCHRRQRKLSDEPLDGLRHDRAPTGGGAAPSRQSRASRAQHVQRGPDPRHRRVRLVRQICQIIVEEAGYRLCWVGYAEQDAARTVRPIAQAGFDEGYLKTANITWADTERGRGPTGTCIRTGQIQIAKNIATDPRLAPWRADALRRGYASSIAIPLWSTRPAVRRADDLLLGDRGVRRRGSDALDRAGRRSGLRHHVLAHAGRAQAGRGGRSGP